MMNNCGKKWLHHPIVGQLLYDLFTAFLCYHCDRCTEPSCHWYAAQKVITFAQILPQLTHNTSSQYTSTQEGNTWWLLVFFASSCVWNSIPTDVRCVPSLSLSKCRLKTYLHPSVNKYIRINFLFWSLYARPWLSDVIKSINLMLIKNI